MRAHPTHPITPPHTPPTHTHCTVELDEDQMKIKFQVYQVYFSIKNNKHYYGGHATLAKYPRRSPPLQDTQGQLYKQGGLNYVDSTIILGQVD